MATLRHLVSLVRSTHKLLDSKSLITDRTIAAQLKVAAFLLIKRETNTRKLWASDTLFTTIPCLEMIPVSISECCEFVEDIKIARSKHRIPKIFEGYYSYVIKGVWSINALGGRGKELISVDLNRYTNLLKLRTRKKEDYYFIHNNYLYCSKPDVSMLMITAFFEEDVPYELLHSDCNCGGYQNKVDDICENPLDKQSFIPGYLEQQVIEIASKNLLSTYFNIITPDESKERLDSIKVQ